MTLFITSFLGWRGLESMWLPLAEICLLVSIDFAAVLSRKTLLRSKIMYSRQGFLLANSHCNLRLQVIFFPCSDNVTYSDSAESNAVIVCLLVFRSIGVMLTIIT